MNNISLDIKTNQRMSIVGVVKININTGKSMVIFPDNLSFDISEQELLDIISAIHPKKEKASEIYSNYFDWKNYRLKVVTVESNNANVDWQLRHFVYWITGM